MLILVAFLLPVIYVFVVYIIKAKMSTSLATTAGGVTGLNKKKASDKAPMKALKSVLAVVRSAAILVQVIVFIVQTWYILLICVLLSATMFVVVLLGANDMSDVRYRLKLPQSQQDQNQTNGESWLKAVDEMGQWYCENVDTYQGSYAPPHPGRKNYFCPLLGESGMNVQDDCSAFVTACLVYGGYYPDYTGDSSFNARAFCKDGSAYDLMLENFNHYVPDDYLTGVYVPKVGDILAYHYEDEDGERLYAHVEILGVIGETECFAYSWGHVVTVLPIVRHGGIGVYVKEMWEDNHDVMDIWQVK